MLCGYHYMCQIGLLIVEFVIDQTCIEVSDDWDVSEHWYRYLNQICNEVSDDWDVSIDWDVSEHWYRYLNTTTSVKSASATAEATPEEDSFGSRAALRRVLSSGLCSEPETSRMHGRSRQMQIVVSSSVKIVAGRSARRASSSATPPKYSSLPMTGNISSPYGWWPWWFLIAGCSASWAKYVEEYDSMRVARCDAKCDGYTPPYQCMDDCLAANYTKPGYCPEENSMSPFEAACIVACSDDSQCPDLAKCCPNDCGITCMRPTGLEDRDDIPPIPENIEIRREKSNLVMLGWRVLDKIGNADSRIADNDSNVRYLVEERHVLGPRYLESRLSSWSVRHVSSKPHASLRGGLRSGHWYQFRVAAVNEIGSRGYSQPSGPLKTAEPRNPREPRNLSLSGARVQSDGKLRILLRWRPPPSDVPIMFYKLFWSRLIHGPANDSILVNHRTVPKDKACYEVKNLDIGCQYFLQVQAVAVYGGRRLASRKASKVFNSTDYQKYDDGEGRSRRCEKHHGELRVRRLICQCAEEIEARLVWSSDSRATRYNVTWREDSCETLTSVEEPPKSSRRISGWRVTDKTRKDIKGLRKNCTYTVNVKSVADRGDKNGERDRISLEERKIGIEFVTNDCQNRQGKRGEMERGFKSSRCRRRKARIKKISETAA